MNNEDLLQKTLAMTIERFGKQSISYESEIANLNAQIVVLNDQIESLSKVDGKKKSQPSDS
jgi:hypothetical protein